MGNYKMDKASKPMLDVDGQIQHLLSKGVRFEITSEADAREYLRKNNNYFKLRAYRKNFPKHPGGQFAGQYINLDFAMLKDLAIIDMRLRYTLLQMVLDVEHFAKIKLLRAVEDSDNDGYEIVEGFFLYLQESDKKNNTSRYNSLIHELDRNKNNPYCGGIISKYEGCYPVWAFIEIVPLGSLINFIMFTADMLNREDLRDDAYLLLTIRTLRNAAAHSNCILHNMGAKDSAHAVNYGLLRELMSRSQAADIEITKATRKNQLKNARMSQIATLLYAHSIMITSEGVYTRARQLLFELVDRMYHHIDYYEDNKTILSSFDFFQKMVDIFFGDSYNGGTRKK